MIRLVVYVPLRCKYGRFKILHNSNTYVSFINTRLPHVFSNVVKLTPAETILRRNRRRRWREPDMFLFLLGLDRNGSRCVGSGSVL